MYMLVVLTVITLFGGIWLSVWISYADEGMIELGNTLSSLHLVTWDSWIPIMHVECA